MFGISWDTGIKPEILIGVSVNTFTVLTPEKTYCIELIAGYVTSVTSEAYRLNFDTAEQMDEYVAEAIKKSTFKTNAEYESRDRLITFSTCSYEYTNARYVVVGLKKDI